MASGIGRGTDGFVDRALVGSHFVLAALPVWACAPLLYMGTMGVIFVLREHSEGLPYQIAYSAQFGDVALLTVVLIGSTVLHRGVALPSWSLGWSFHGVCIGVAVACGAAWWWFDRPPHSADIYHHLFVAPLFIYLALSLTPVVASGTRTRTHVPPLSGFLISSCPPTRSALSPTRCAG